MIDLQNSKQGSYWMNTTDLMSGLMIVFMFIAISYMINVQIDERKAKNIAEEWVDTRSRIIKALHKEFDKDLKKWGAEINDYDLSIRFVSPKILFAANESDVPIQFKKILDEFFPRYITLLNEYKNDITEIRIEGHTSDEWGGVSELTAYMNNMKLSQDRTRNVLSYCLIINQNILKSELKWARNLITANGLSSSQLLYKKDGKTPDRKKSRRVEFKVRTTAEEKIEKILAQK